MIVEGQIALLSVREVAQILNIHVNTARRWGNRGVIKSYRIGPRGDRRFEREDVFHFLVKNTEKGVIDEQSG